MTEKRQRILLIEEATFHMKDGVGIDPVRLTFALFGGDFVLLRTENALQGTAFGDVCCGLIAPSAGAIRFLDLDWRELTPDRASALRGRIGRLTVGGRWIHQIGLLENIVQQQMHHTRTDARTLFNEASALALRFGLPGAPMGPPGAYSAEELQRAGCVRACLGRPALILLEEPTTGLSGETSVALINIIREHRSRGSAVVWMTCDNTIWQRATIPATRRLRWLGRELIETGMQP